MKWPRGLSASGAFLTLKDASDCGCEIVRDPFVRRVAAERDSHDRLSAPIGSPEEEPPCCIQAVAHLLRALAETQRDLVEHHVVQHRGAGDLPALFRQALGRRTMLLYEASDAIPAQRLKHRPQSEAARPARELWDVCRRIAAVAGVLGEIARRLAHGPAMRRGVADDRKAAVVWSLQPFVAVDCPGVGALHMLGERLQLWRRTRPEA